MKKIVFIFLLAAAATANAQDYKTALGLRAGFPFGFTIKHFVSQKAALEGIVSPRFAGVELVGLVEIYLPNPAFGVDRLHWYFGGGGHIGFYDGRKYDPYGRPDGFVSFGIDGIAGLEYNFVPVPINISVDVKPAINFFPEPDLWPDGAISIRYYFGK